MNSGVRHNEAQSPHSSSLHLGDIYFVIFRHKWKIVILTLLGLAAALTYWAIQKPSYQSSMTILVKYVSDKMDPTANDSERTSLMNQNEAIMGAETKILTSFDVAQEVATNIGPDRILGKINGVNNNDPVAAALVVMSHLEVTRELNMMHIKYSNPDINVVKPVLLAIDAAYHEKSDQFHQQIDWSTQALTEKTAQYKLDIDDLNQRLLAAKAKVGFINIESPDNFFATEATRLKQELAQAQESLDEHNAMLAQLAALAKPDKTTDSGTNPPVAHPQTEVPLDQTAQYKTASEHVTYLQNKISDYLNQQGYTEENKLVKAARDELAVATKTKTELEKKYPSLTQPDSSAAATTTATTGGTGMSAPDAAIVFSTLPTRIKTLQLQLSQNQTQALAANSAVFEIEDLERQKKAKEDAYQKFNTSLQDDNLQSVLGPNGNSNIADIDSPMPPARDDTKFHKILYGLAASGLVLGLAWAFLIEFYLDRSIKRPVDIQNKLKIPFFLSIPDLSRNNRKGLAAANQLRQLTYQNGETTKNGEVAVVKESSLDVMGWEINRRFNSYYDALRDRLVVYFESINLTRKPKLVAVTSTHKGAGVSTIAAGLAASLSETGDGRVLLVDMNLEHGAAQQFFNGRANCKLDDALESETRDNARVQENLYFVTEDTVSDRLPRALPKRFASLIPKLKASDYDYIIFDMPPVSPTSVTSRLAGFMDTVMLVIESEKTDQQIVQQANALLAQSKANVTAVLNKTKHYVPSLLHRDFLSDV